LRLVFGKRIGLESFRRVNRRGIYLSEINDFFREGGGIGLNDDSGGVWGKNCRR